MYNEDMPPDSDDIDGWRMEQLIVLGHAAACAKRMVTGDGKCECLPADCLDCGHTAHGHPLFLKCKELTVKGMPCRCKGYTHEIGKLIRGIA